MSWPMLIGCLRIVCPYVDLNPATERVLKLEYRHETEFVDVSESGAYLELLRRLWAAGETFIIVEHDIVPWPGALRLMDKCPEPLCLHQYPYALLDGGQLMYAWGGCTKYGTACMELWPDALEAEVGWRNLMEHLITGLGNRGWKMHLHHPPVSHIKDLEEWAAYCERLRLGRPRS